MVGFPGNFSETPAQWQRKAPEFGQHTEEILSEIDYSKDNITRLKEEDIIR
jgi:crotonobetainyl-CoA:carnitine CoA-transferase CaiB-like acyl-CoA transferase